MDAIKGIDTHYTRRQLYCVIACMFSKKSKESQHFASEL